MILVVAFFIFQFCPEYIINLFGQESDLYMEFAVKCFRVYLLACFMIGAGAVTGIFFQAIGKPVPADYFPNPRHAALWVSVGCGGHPVGRSCWRRIVRRDLFDNFRRFLEKDFQ